MKGRRLSMVITTVVITTVVITTVVGCATITPMPPVRLRIDGAPDDATVWVDDRLIGTVADGRRQPSVLLPPGFHRVEIRRPGSYAHFDEIDLPRGGEAAIHVDLRPVLD